MALSSTYTYFSSHIKWQNQIAIAKLRRRNGFQPKFEPLTWKWHQARLPNSQELRCQHVTSTSFLYPKRMQNKRTQKRRWWFIYFLNPNTIGFTAQWCRPCEIAEYQLTHWPIADIDWLPSVENEWSWMLVLRMHRHKTHHQPTGLSLKAH